MSHLCLILCLATLPVPHPRADEVRSATPSAAETAASMEWNARAAEHLPNRAAFGARPGEIAESVALGHAAAVERLLALRSGGRCWRSRKAQD